MRHTNDARTAGAEARPLGSGRLVGLLGSCGGGSRQVISLKPALLTAATALLANAPRFCSGLGVPILLALTTLGCGEQRVVHYASYLDASRDGAVLRGWIPSYVPQSAVEIVEVHDLDTNALLMRFRADPDAVRMMVASLGSIDPKELRPWPRNMSPPRGVPWPIEPWNRPSHPLRRAFTAHTGGSEVHCIVIEGPPETVYAWTCGD